MLNLHGQIVLYIAVSNVPELLLDGKAQKFVP